MRRKSGRAIVGAAVMMLAGVCFSSERSEEAPAQWKVPVREGERKNPMPAEQRSIATGKGVYVKNCADCHGRAGKGDGPKGRDLQPKPSDLSSPQVAGQSDGALYWKITTGRRPMPAFAKLLPDGDRWHVVNYIRTLNPAPQPQRKP